MLPKREVNFINNFFAVQKFEKSKHFESHLSFSFDTFQSIKRQNIG